MRSIFVGLTFGFALIQPVLAFAQEGKPLGQGLYDVVVSGLPNGAVPGHRANHIKGAMFEGRFVPSPEAAKLSAAALFQGAAVPMVIRYSTVGGIPDVPDNSGSTSIRGMAFSFKLPEGAGVDLLCINMPFFIAKTPEDFIALNLAGQSTAPKDVHPTPFEQWTASHPEAKTFLSFPRPMPASFGTQDYFAIHAYKLVDAGGADRFVRFHVVPEAGKQVLSAEDAAKTAPNVLIDEMHARVAKAPVTYRLEAQIAEPGDVTNDPTVAWPDSRKVVNLGTITVASAVADSAEAEKKVVFMPNKTVKGFGLSDDPFLDARAATYEVSYARRNATP